MTALSHRSVAEQNLVSGKRVVIKIGSALLVDQQTGNVHKNWLATLAADVAAMRARGQDVLIVSSGAIAVGRRHLGFGPGKLKLDESQAAAAAGMIRLAHAYQDALGPHDLTVAQILLTLEDSENRRRYLNARSTLNQLLKAGAVPLINENDTVATDEIRFGDNDRLAARLAVMVSADILVLLSSVDGLYDGDPTAGAGTRHIPLVEGTITPEIEAMAGASMTSDGSGGMQTKLVAANLALQGGCRMVIADGTGEHPLKSLDNGTRATWFIPTANPKTARKHWIAGALKPSGALVVDAGAAHALNQGKSLLPAGVIGIEGTFHRGDAVMVKDQAGTLLARGLIAYSSEDAMRIIGARSGDIAERLGYRGRDEMIHRDDLVLN